MAIEKQTNMVYNMYMTKKGVGMVPKLYKVFDSVDLYVYGSNKFKSEMLSVKFVLPCDVDMSPKNTLMISVLRRGTEKFVSLAHINKRLDELYASCLSVNNSLVGDNQVLGLTAEIIGSKFAYDGDSKKNNGEGDILDGVIEVISQILFYPATDENGDFKEIYVSGEKVNMCDMIRSRINDTASFSVSRCREIMFGGQPYGISLMGSEEQISRITAHELTQHWKEVMSRSRLHCFYLGSQDPEVVVEKLRRHFKDRAVNDPYLPIVPNENKDISADVKVKRVDEKMPVVQGKLVLGFKFPHNAQGYAERVLNELYGSSPISKLFVNVREKLGLCYSCSSVYVATKKIMLAAAGINVSDREEAENEMISQLESIRRGEFSQLDLDSVKKSIDSGIRSGASDSLEYIQGFYFYRNLFGIDENIDEFREKISAVTAEDVVKAARSATLDTVYFLEGSVGDENGTDCEYGPIEDTEA